MLPATDRFARQAAIVPRERLVELSATVVGCGAVGRQVAVQLAALGVRRLQLVDFDRVDATNVTTQGYAQADVGRLKVEATADAVQAIDPAIDVEVVADRFRPSRAVGAAVFCCVDSISSRAVVWKSARTRCDFWVDGRMRGEVIRVLAAADEGEHEAYGRSLFAQSEAQVGACAARGVIYGAAIAAGLMVHQFARWLRKLPVDHDTLLNLTAGEWTLGE
jgi:sulfur carrier protein ThiS adenylyltransferase